jgi:hypothetical protein
MRSTLATTYGLADVPVRCGTANCLSDFRHSRVYMTDNGEIHLTSNSRDAVREKWEIPEALEAAEAFRSEVMELCGHLGGPPTAAAL